MRTPTKDSDGGGDSTSVADYGLDAPGREVEVGHENGEGRKGRVCRSTWTFPGGSLRTCFQAK